jgi:hypothetical protein
MQYKYEIKYKDDTVLINREISESISRFNKRIQFIKILENNNIEWKETLKLAKIWYYIKYYKVKYSQTLYNQIMKYDKLLNI